MIVLFAVLFGLVVGSFLNVVIHRVPLRQSIAWPGSRCPECGTPIRSVDNVPLLSYLLLRGKCRDCGARISPRYPLVEALTGALFGVAAYRYGVSLELVSALVLIGVLVALAGTDLEHRLLPNAIVFPATAAGLVLSVILEPSRWWVYVLSTVAVAGALFALAIARPGGMGMGDVKMGGMLGAFLGLYAFLAVFLGALLGAVVAGVLLVTGRMQRRTALPFGVFLAVAGVLVSFAGPRIWSSYSELFLAVIGEA
ncbi:MAG: Leader peptidase (Prepilin peptidase) / N-methyltransferase [uncultured Rubrobacteraceae bacterium]|uniref:Leader peptidase (Prepilin peptidase) / N-methyltransferase n=1 Tax=uncultured Rubrobacteraceae bacterium TaxID=349277 RepID=A0A6J4SC64_9ACTN|nr:MAG: Leader peptidase (Prepilin peptidase) / N-methyltransferase [uncultured Rubrobacteraceae bacterium]